MNPLFKPKLIAGNSNRPLAAAIARRISIHRSHRRGRRTHGARRS